MEHHATELGLDWFDQVVGTGGSGVPAVVLGQPLACAARLRAHAGWGPAVDPVVVALAEPGHVC